MLIPKSIQGFDIDAAVERMLGLSALWWQALGLFVQHFSQWEREWLAARGDDEVERKKVHALRSAAANVGADQLSCAAAVLEELLSLRLAGQQIAVPPSVRWYLQDCFREAWRAASEAKLRESIVPLNQP